MKKKYQQLIIPFLIIFLYNNINAEPLIQKGEKIYTSSDSLYYDLKNKEITLLGNASIKTKDKSIKGSFIKLNQNNQKVHIKNNAVIQAKGETLYGDEVSIDYKKQTGSIKKGKIFVTQTNFYLSGDKIEKKSKNRYEIENASITTCDTPKKAWEIKASKLLATIDGYGFAYHARLNTIDYPTFYVPFMFFPVKTKRESGLLAPQLELSSSYGFEYHQPLYLALSKNLDTTIYYHFHEKRSDRKGVELRYKNSVNNYTEIYYDEILNDPHSYLNNDLKENKTRYWFRAKSDFKNSSGLKLHLDIDHASDPDYLSEFDKDFLGYDHVNKSFYDNFGRSLEPDDDYKRTNRIILTKHFNNSGIEAELLWRDDLIIKESDLNNRIAHSLPRLSFDLSTTNLFDLPVQYSIESEYNYFHRIYGEKGHRYNITPKIDIPFNIYDSMTIVPGFYVSETIWISEDESENYKNEYNLRQYFGFDIEASSSIFKTFDIGSKKIKKIKHKIMPSLKYSYIPDIDQDQYPKFDDFDDHNPKKEIELSLIQTLTSKELIPSKDKTDSFDYREFLRFELSQAYDIEEFDKAKESDLIYEEKAFKNLEIYFRFLPNNYINFEFDGKWSHKEALFEERNFLVATGFKDGSNYRLEHRFTDKENESLKFSAKYIFSPSINIHGFYETILMENNSDSDDYEKELGLEYSAQCWTSDISYNQTEKEKKVTLKVNLKGLGGIYNSFSKD